MTEAVFIGSSGLVYNVTFLSCVYKTFLPAYNRAKIIKIDQPSIDRASYWLLHAANRMLSRSSGNHDWLLANASACV